MRFSVIAMAASLTVGTAPALSGQMIKWSQFGEVSQMLGPTNIEVRYSRPVARGRELFGALVPYGVTWAPGADSATTISFSTDVIFNGEKLSAGKYSIWMIPDPNEWTVILSSAADVFHQPYPEGHDVMRFSVSPKTGMHMETLTFYFPVVDGPQAMLAFHWGTTVLEVPIEIEVDESG